MHGFADHLSETEIRSLADYLKRFAPETFSEPIEAAAAAGPRPTIDPALIARGAQVYVELGCPSCHGPTGKGDGPAATALRTARGEPLRPHDFALEDIRRPRPNAGDPRLDDRVAAIYLSITTGLSGTPMASFAGTAPDADLWAVAGYVASLYQPTAPSSRPGIPPVAIELDRKAKSTAAGYWPGSGLDAEERLFGRTIALQGQGPAGLTPAEQSLDASQCGRCHAKQRTEWTGSLHAAAGSPGLIGQVVRLTKGASIESCQRCHAPLAEQQPVIRPGHRGGDDDDLSYAANPAFDPSFREQGITCAACHVRGKERFGPPANPGSGLLANASYPMTELAIFERADFCLPCHQLSPRNALAGKPLLDTYREWLHSPYMPRGIQCQHCHMPNREHTWKGVHDPETFRQAVSLAAITQRGDNGVVSVRARLTNVGAGHYVPTTPTPSAWIIAELVDANQRPIPGARAQRRIGRKLEFKGGKFHEIEDTRIPPGQFIELAAGWRAGTVATARFVRIAVEVIPDDYYEGLYRDRLAGALPALARDLFERALERASKSKYTALSRLWPINGPTRTSSP